jgi:hypothetical protein
VHLIGEIVRLQVQQASLKVGGPPRRRYDPGPIQFVPALVMTEAGVCGLAENGEMVSDVHHRDHPASKNRDGVNGISVGFTSHYHAMRERFGGHLSDGIAGENILIQTDYFLSEDDLLGGMTLVSDQDERSRLTAIVVATPCVEFARFALRFPDDARPDRTVSDALTFLNDGVRGYYARVANGPVTIRLGGRVFVG